MVVYADTIFVINFTSVYILMYAISKFIIKISPKKIRLIAASAVGALSSVIIFCIEMPVLLSYALRLSAIIIMLLIAFFEQKKQILVQMLWFFVLGGAITFAMIFIVSLAAKQFKIITKAGIMYFDIAPEFFLPLLLISYLIMILFIKMIKNRKNKKYYLMNVTHNDKTISISALFDSGNMLKEPITGKDVSILEWESAKKLFDLDCDYSEIEKHAEEMKLWAIPFKSLGNPNGILFAFVADKIEIPEENKCINKSFIGIYDKPLSKNREYRALINACLF